MLNFFASEDGPHISLKAEEVFKIGDVSITNSIIYGFLVALTMLIVGIWVAKRSKIKPVGGLVQITELALDFVVNMLEGTLGSRAKAAKYAPMFAVFFIFIVVSNLSGLLPWVGTGLYVNVDGVHTPIFRPFTADLNATIAMAIIAIGMVQYLSIKESGFMGHLKHYFTDKPLNPINLFIGILEVFGELTRVLSLSLRLFLNTAVGEILIAVFIYVGSYGSPLTVLPIILFEILVALIQAYVFTVLTATYLGLAIAHGEHGHEEDDGEHPDPLIMTQSEPTRMTSG